MKEREEVFLLLGIDGSILPEASKKNLQSDLEETYGVSVHLIDDTNLSSEGVGTNSSDESGPTLRDSGTLAEVLRKYPNATILAHIGNDPNKYNLYSGIQIRAFMDRVNGLKGGKESTPSIDILNRK